MVDCNKPIIFAIKGSNTLKHFMKEFNVEPNENLIILEKSEYQEVLTRLEAAKVVDNPPGKVQKPSSKDIEYPF